MNDDLETTASRSAARLRAAAWVPDDDPHRPYEDAAALAARWIVQQGQDEGVAPVVVANTKSVSLPPSLAVLAQRGGLSTPLSPASFGAGPVVAFLPDAKSLRHAMDVARGSSLVAIEGHSFALAQWAAGLGATNLVAGTEPKAGLPAEVTRSLDSAILFGGNNGWSGSHEKDHAKKRLEEHVRAGRLSPADAAAYVMSQGISDVGGKRLRSLLERI